MGEKKIFTPAQEKAATFVSRPFPEFLSDRLEMAWRKTLGTKQPGDTMEDGSLYLGLHDNAHWLATAEDARGPDGKRLRMSFNAAVLYARMLKAHGHNDWKLPPGEFATDDEESILSLMFNKRNLGTFRNSYEESRLPIASPDSSWYWSSTVDKGTTDMAWGRNFDYGIATLSRKNLKGLVRCVRSVPLP